MPLYGIKNWDVVSFFFHSRNLSSLLCSSLLGKRCHDSELGYISCPSVMFFPPPSSPLFPKGTEKETEKETQGQKGQVSDSQTDSGKNMREGRWADYKGSERSAFWWCWTSQLTLSLTVNIRRFRVLNSGPFYSKVFSILNLS